LKSQRGHLNLAYGHTTGVSYAAGPGDIFENLECAGYVLEALPSRVRYPE